MKNSFLLVVLATALLPCSVTHANGWQHAPKDDARLTFAAPESSFVRVRVRDRIRTHQYVNRRGELATTQWPLILRFESRTAVGFAASATAEGQKREALIMRDPDGCPNLFSLVDGLAERTDAPRPDVEALRLAAHLFDFEALLRLANHLSQGSIDRTADA